MNAGQKHEIKVGGMFSDGKGLIYRVNHFVFSDVITHLHDGVPLEDNIVHLDVYSEDGQGVLTHTANKDFVHIQFIHPLPIRPNYIREIGFLNNIEDGVSTLRYNDYFFLNLNHIHGVYNLHNINGNHNAVQYMHEVQNAIAI